MWLYDRQAFRIMGRDCNIGKSSIGTTLPGLFGKPNWVEPELEGDVSAAPFGDGCKKGIRGAKDR